MANCWAGREHRNEEGWSRQETWGEASQTQNKSGIQSKIEVIKPLLPHLWANNLLRKMFFQIFGDQQGG